VAAYTPAQLSEVQATDRHDVQRALLNRLLIVACLVDFYGLWQLALNVETGLMPLYACAAGGVAIFAAYCATRFSPTLAKGLYVAACFVAVLAWRFLADSPAVSYAFVLPVLAAGALFGPVGALLSALVNAGVLAFGFHAEAGIVPAVVLGAGSFLWLLLQPLYYLLEWQARHSLESTILAEQLRDQRGKLNRTIKDLDASYKLLQRTNQELAVARQEAEALHKLRNRFATNLSHELRTPLSIILGFSQLICTEPGLYGYDGWSVTMQRDLAEIRRNASYLSELVDDIVDLARVDALSMPIRREDTDLASLVADAVATVESLARAKGLALRVRCAGSLPLLHVDPIRIRQVLFNLVTNAIRYTDSGSIDVSARSEDGKVVVSVADTGRGIADEEKASIFNEFYQIGRPKDGPDAGKGLGLAIARRLVQLHGGSIWVESVPGRGSVFSFSLPLMDKTVALLRSGSEAPVPKSQQTPLVGVLNDDGVAAGYLSRRIEGYQFVAAAEYEELLELTADQPPLTGLIVNLAPDSREAVFSAEALARLPEGMALIECSLPSASWLVRGRQFATVLTKPISREKLVGALDSLLPRKDKPSILVVDDDRAFVQLVLRTLQAMPERSLDSRVAYTGQDALERMRVLRPDLVLLDLVMPELSGFDVVDAMRRDFDLRDIPVVALTAATPGEDHLATQGVVFKLARTGPFRPGELVGLISTALDLSRAVPDAMASTG